MPRRIIVVGSINVDLSIRMLRLPRPGETLAGEDCGLDLGGKGANQAIAAARLGGHVHFHGAVGADHLGGFAKAALVQEHIAHLDIQDVAARATGVASILTSHAGLNMIALSPGANNALEVQAITARFQSGDILLLQNEISPEANLRLAKAMRAAGGMVILDPAPASGVSKELMAQCDIITPNEGEAGLLLATTIIDDASAFAAARQLAELGAGAAIVKLGDKGCVVHVGQAAGALGEKAAWHCPPVRVVAVDSVAAGDCFNGAFAVALAEGQSLREACHFASVAASLSVMRRGASASLPSRAELDAVMAI